MKEYFVEITEYLSRTVPVKANNESQAIEMVSVLYRAEGIVLDSEDFVAVDFKPIESEIKI